MKYIKKYKLFESIDSDDYARATIGDMALDLEDDGFNVSISKYSIHKDPTGTHGKIYVCITLNGNSGMGIGGERFHIHQIYDFITRMDNYLSDNNFILDFISYIYDDGSWTGEGEGRAYSVKELLENSGKEAEVSRLNFFYKK